MIEWLMDPTVWAALLSLTALEIVLGIDNVVFLTVITGHLPEEQARRARQIGLFLALLFRILLLFAITWITGLTADILPSLLPGISWRDVILIAGGLFLIAKATQEMHGEMEGDAHDEETGAVKASFNAVIGQIVLIDAIFSIDSIITAVGMADDIKVMIAAVIIAIAVMYFAAETVSTFIERHPTTKMLALAFLLLIGVALVADGFNYHIERQYIYFAIGFALLVEFFNLLAMRRKKGILLSKGLKTRVAAYRRRQKASSEAS
ncbi:MAG: TerC family protein [Hyphomicrobiales bacterium]|nr:TerC family protein [Hyphomicrobiales bacterium]